MEEANGRAEQDATFEPGDNGSAALERSPEGEDHHSIDIFSLFDDDRGYPKKRTRRKTRDPDKWRLEHRKCLEAVLEAAVNPEAVAEILRVFHIEATILNKDPEKVAFNANFRICDIDGLEYILCPVPFLFDDEHGFEVGFAVDVDEDYFLVKPYIINVKNGKSIILAQLPHCVHAAITIDADSYDRIDNEVIATSNKASAIFFVTNLINDLAVGIDSPVEFFDDSLYLQLLNRITYDDGTCVRDITGRETWNSGKWCSLKFRHVMAQYDTLDPKSPFHENNVLRLDQHLHQLMFGFEDTLHASGFIDRLPLEMIRSHVDHIYDIATSDKLVSMERTYNNRIGRMLNVFHVTGVVPPAKCIQEGYDHISRFNGLDDEFIDQIIELGKISGIMPRRKIILKGLDELVEMKQFNPVPIILKGLGVTLSEREVDHLFEVLVEKRVAYDDMNGLCEELSNKLQRAPSPAFFTKKYNVDELWRPRKEVRGTWTKMMFCDARIKGLVAILERTPDVPRVHAEAQYDRLVESLVEAVESALAIPDEGDRSRILTQDNLAPHLASVYKVLVEKRRASEIFELGEITGNATMIDALKSSLSPPKRDAWITALVLDDSFELAARMAEILGVKWEPAPEVIELTFTWLLENMWLDAVTVVESMSGVTIPERLVRTRLDQLLAAGNGSAAAVLMARTGVYLPDRSNLCWWARNLKTL